MSNNVYEKMLKKRQKYDNIYKKQKEVCLLQYIGKLNLEILEKYKETIITDKVILTEERKLHIYEKHMIDYDIIINNIKATVKRPIEIIEDLKNKDTLFFIRKLNKNNLNVIIKLNTVNSKEHPQNSIMTAWIIRDTNLKKLEEKIKLFTRKNKNVIIEIQ